MQPPLRYAASMETGTLKIIARPQQDTRNGRLKRRTYAELRVGERYLRAAGLTDDAEVRITARVGKIVISVA